MMFYGKIKGCVGIVERKTGALNIGIQQRQWDYKDLRKRAVGLWASMLIRSRGVIVSVAMALLLILGAGSRAKAQTLPDGTWADVALCAVAIEAIVVTVAMFEIELKSVLWG